MNLKVKYEPQPCRNNTYRYFVYDRDSFCETQVTPKEAVAILYVNVTDQAQKLVNIVLIDNSIQQSEICEIAKRQICNLIIKED